MLVRSPTRASSVRAKSWLQLPDPDLVDCPHECQNENCAKGAKPIRLVVGGGDRELAVRRPARSTRRYCLHAITRNAIGARSKVRILHLAVVDHLSPVAILPLQFVLEMNLLRRGEAESGVVDLQSRESARADARSNSAELGRFCQ